MGSTNLIKFLFYSIDQWPGQILLAQLAFKEVQTERGTGKYDPNAAACKKSTTREARWLSYSHFTLPRVSTLNIFLPDTALPPV
jgi:hypothetical protein